MSKGLIKDGGFLEVLHQNFLLEDGNEEEWKEERKRILAESREYERFRDSLLQSYLD